jgi:ribA/ribD-fused uncharacterized protein
MTCAIVSLTEEKNVPSFFFEGLNRANTFNLRKNLANRLKEELSSDLKEVRFYQIDMPYGCFSNYSKHPVFLKEKIWPTSEHYYQAQKFSGTPLEERIRLASSPVNASKIGRCHPTVRSGWESEKKGVMRDVIYAKFTQHPDLKQILLSTGNATIIEDSSDDYYWGDGSNGTGQNMLGQLLMTLRSELRRSEI